MYMYMYIYIERDNMCKQLFLYTHISFYACVYMYILDKFNWH